MCAQILIFERDPVIAQDIKETVLGLWPEARTQLAGSVGEASAFLQDAAEWTWAILHGSLEELRNLALLGGGSLASTTTIAIHSRIAEEPFANWVFVPPPFTSPELEAALRSRFPRLTTSGAA